MKINSINSINSINTMNIKRQNFGLTIEKAIIEDNKKITERTNGDMVEAKAAIEQLKAACSDECHIYLKYCGEYRDFEYSLNCKGYGQIGSFDTAVNGLACDCSTKDLQKLARIIKEHEHYGHF